MGHRGNKGPLKTKRACRFLITCKITEDSALFTNCYTAHRHLKVAQHHVKVTRRAKDGGQSREARASVRRRLDRVAAGSQHARGELDDEG
jgi:hypothetical protein